MLLLLLALGCLLCACGKEPEAVEAGESESVGAETLSSGDGHDCSKFRSEWIEDEPFTCGETGVQRVVCTECGEVLSERTITKKHAYEGVIIKEKSCAEPGETKYTCVNCGDFYIKESYSDDHVQGEIEILTPATETASGTKAVHCSVCNKVYREFSYVDNGFHRHGKLSVEGPDLVDQYGEKFQLYGLSTHGLQWFSDFVNFDTFCSLQEGFTNNVVRLALTTDENGYCSGGPTVKREMLEAVHRGIQIATDLGMYVIVDWHMVGATNPDDKNPLTYLEESKEFFSYISEYYKDYDNILYEIMNEPNGPTTWAQCKRYANEVIPCIRANTDAIILVGSSEWSTDMEAIMASPLVGYENIMYTYHFYAADHRRTSRVEYAYDNGLPVFISEFGFMESSGDGALSISNGNKWKQVLDLRNISYVAWNISNSSGTASIFKHNTTDLYDVSDSNLKEWGVYLKNWYSSKAVAAE